MKSPDGKSRGGRLPLDWRHDQVVTSTQTFIYETDRIALVSPSGVSVLVPREGALILVTAPAFYFIGSVPKRYIVQATIADSVRFPPDGTDLSRSDNEPHEARVLVQMSQAEMIRK